MNSTTKRVRLYIVQGIYPGGNGWEDLTAATNGHEARTDLAAYRDNDPTGIFRLVRRIEEVPA